MSSQKQSYAEQCIISHSRTRKMSLTKYVLNCSDQNYAFRSMEEVLTNEDTVRAGWLLLVAQVLKANCT